MRGASVRALLQHQPEADEVEARRGPAMHVALAAAREARGMRPAAAAQQAEQVKIVVA